METGRRFSRWHNCRRGAVPMPLDNPTALTDYLLAFASVGFAVAVSRKIGPENCVSGWFWCAAFITGAISAAAGGTYHGVDPRVEPTTFRTLWNVTVFSMGGCVALIAAAVHSASIGRTDGTLEWLGAGIAVTVFGVSVQQGAFSGLVGWEPNPVYHLIQIVGLYFFFRAAQTTRDRPGLQRV